MGSLSYTFHTHNRDEFISVCEKLTAFLTDKVEEKGNTAVNIEIKGDYASGKSLVADAIKAAFTNKDIEAPTWKHTDTENTELNGNPISISFVNARFDSFNMIFKRATLQRENNAGIIFISNKPRLNIAKLFKTEDISKPDVTVDVSFPEGEPKPKQFGPFKIGQQSEMTNRVIKIHAPDSYMKETISAYHPRMEPLFDN